MPRIDYRGVIMHDNASRRRFLRSTAAALAGSGLLGVPTLPWAQQKKLVINTYGGRWEKFWRGELLPPFAKLTSIDTTLDVGLGRNFIANLRAAGANNPPYSVLMINENLANILRSEGYFEPIPEAKVPNLAQVYPNLRNPDNNGVRGIISPIGLGYRKDLVKNPPTAWADLWTNPEFKGKIGLYQIANTAGMLFLLLTAKIFGGSQDAIDVAFAEIKKLQPFAQVDFSGSLTTLLQRGDVTVGMIDLPEIVALKRKGVPVEMVIPKEGVVAFEQSFNILKNAPAKEEAYRYINYILDPVVQESMAKEFFTSPSNTRSKVPTELAADIPVAGDKMSTLVQFDWTRANARSTEITERWNREMK